MAEFEVFNEVDLGEAVWRSRPGDTIFLRKGHFGRVVLKAGNLVFPPESDSSIAQIAGVLGSCNLINARWQPENIKSVFVWRKRLPFNLRLPIGSAYLHPSGVSVTVVGHQPGATTITTNGAVPVEDQLPKSLVDVEIPSTVDVDFDLLRKEGVALPTDELAKRFAEDAKLRQLFYEAAEGLPFGELEYLAVWATNQFLRRYSVIAELGPVRGFSIAEFRDGGTVRYKRPGPSEWIAHNQGYIRNFSTVPLEAAEQARLFRECLDAPDYSVAEYIEFALDHLNYSTAIVGMAQLLEANGLAGKWVAALESSGLTPDQQRYLAEVMLCRNVILHQKQCAIKEENVKEFGMIRNRFGVEPLSEYRIYATKRPWLWYRQAVLPYLQAHFKASGSTP